MIKVAIIGTVGVPANYGGFETLVENIIKCNNSEELQYSVYCSSKNYKEKYWVYKGAKNNLSSSQSEWFAKYFV